MWKASPGYGGAFVWDRTGSQRAPSLCSSHAEGEAKRCLKDPLESSSKEYWFIGPKQSPFLPVFISLKSPNTDPMQRLREQAPLCGLAEYKPICIRRQSSLKMKKRSVMLPLVNVRAVHFENFLMDHRVHSPWEANFMKILERWSWKQMWSEFWH